MPGQVHITGLRELQAALRKMDSDLPKKLRVALNAAGQLVVDDAQPRVPKRSGRAAASMKLQSSQREARIAAGGRKAPWYPWLDFGGQGKVKGRPAERPFRTEGRYIYPAVRNQATHIQEALQAQLSALIAEAGLEES